MSETLGTAALENQEGVDQMISNALHMLRPPPAMKPSEWAQTRSRMPEGNAMRGPLRLDNAPYQREPMDM
ncbi:phage terminase large subunit family protein, partial [Xylella fastidiosa subsp. multiplex]|nr:phage terminase large subunit family protein [Xylella fastidiosa subsp. multiplex]